MLTPIQEPLDLFHGLTNKVFMLMRCQLFIVFLLLASAGNEVCSQTKADKKTEANYLQRAKEVQAEVMSLPDTFFSRSNRPEASAGSPAIILAKKTAILAD